MLKNLFFIGAGSFIGGAARYLVTCALRTWCGSSFPWGTLLVNVTGCFFVGILYGLSERGGLPGPETRLFLTVGFCGSFTTFSTFINENFGMLGEGDLLHAALYPAASFFLGMAAVYAGRIITRTA